MHGTKVLKQVEQLDKEVSDMSDNKLNIENFKKVRDYIAKEHTNYRFNMYSWMDTNNPKVTPNMNYDEKLRVIVDESNELSCQTVMCIAGTARYLSFLESERWFNVEPAKWLGLSTVEADELFIAGNSDVALRLIDRDVVLEGLDFIIEYKEFPLPFWDMIVGSFFKDDPEDDDDDTWDEDVDGIDFD